MSNADIAIAIILGLWIFRLHLQTLILGKQVTRLTGLWELLMTVQKGGTP